MKEFNKFARYKIKIQKSVAFLHTNDDLTENAKKKIIPLIIASQK
jgi:hypothetical protein